MILRVIIVAVIGILCGCSESGHSQSYSIEAPRHQIDSSHSAFTRVLAKRVEHGKVDYEALKDHIGDLESYLDELAAVPESAFNQWSDKERMAFLINLYNAATLKLVVEHYPVKSIKDIGGFKGPWKQPVVRLFGSYRSLEYVEHTLLRSMGEPRIHFAINCASIGCPVLRREAYRAADLESQLDDQTRQFLRDSTKNPFEGERGILRLSPIFSWFKDDFTASGESVEAFVAPYFDEPTRTNIASGNVTLKSAKYDWSLNKR